MPLCAAAFFPRQRFLGGRAQPTTPAPMPFSLRQRAIGPAGGRSISRLQQVTGGYHARPFGVSSAIQSRPVARFGAAAMQQRAVPRLGAGAFAGGILDVRAPFGTPQRAFAGGAAAMRLRPMQPQVWGAAAAPGAWRVAQQQPEARLLPRPAGHAIPFRVDRRAIAGLPIWPPQGETLATAPTVLTTTDLTAPTVLTKLTPTTGALVPYEPGALVPYGPRALVPYEPAGALVPYGPRALVPYEPAGALVPYEPPPRHLGLCLNSLNGCKEILLLEQ